MGNVAVSKLVDLHRRLAALRRRRWLLRFAAAAGVWLLVALGLLAACFAADYLGQLNRPARAAGLLVWLAATLWVSVRYLLPACRRREQELDVALLVEQQQKIDSDLVAALQFESPQSSRWGSRQLTSAVIERVARAAPGLDVFAGLSYAPALRRAAAALLTLAVLAAAAVAFPGHTAAFFNRFLLGSAHYPTRTKIESLAINGRQVPLGGGKVVATAAYGLPLQFAVGVSGQVPADGHVDLVSLRNGRSVAVPLQPTADQPAEFTGRLNQLVESLRFQLYLGDAWTDPATVEVIPLPGVDVRLRVTPPAYAAAGQKPADAPPGSRHISVIEGSRVDVRLTSTKPLREAVLSIGETDYAFAREAPAAPDATSGPGGEAAGETWLLTAEGTPLERVREAVQYAVQVTDADALQLEEPIRGYIRLKPDREPKVFADVTTRHVVPTATPTIWYGASDDYGLAALRAKVIVQRPDEEQPGAPRWFELPLSDRPRKVSPQLFRLDAGLEKTLERGALSPQLQAAFAENGAALSPGAAVVLVRPGDRWHLADPGNFQHYLIRKEHGRLNVYRQFRIDLGQLDLKLGDEVRVQLEALDYRGDDLPGESTLSDPVLLTVTDERGVLSAMVETDQRSAQQLNAIILRQLGIGESP